MANDLIEIPSSKAMTQLPPGIRQGLRVRYAPPDYERIDGCVVRLNDAEKRIAMDVLQQQLAPCGGVFATRCLAKVDAATVSREKAPIDEEARRIMLVSTLESLPADLLAKACRTWVETEKWRPTPAELRKLIERELLERKTMLDALTKPTVEAPTAIPAKRADPEHVSMLVDRLRRNLDVKTGEPLPEKGDAA